MEILVQKLKIVVQKSSNNLHTKRFFDKMLNRKLPKFHQQNDDMTYLWFWQLNLFFFLNQTVKQVDNKFWTSTSWNPSPLLTIFWSFFKKNEEKKHRFFKMFSFPSRDRRNSDNRSTFFLLVKNFFGKFKQPFSLKLASFFDRPSQPLVHVKIFQKDWI